MQGSWVAGGGAGGGGGGGAAAEEWADAAVSRRCNEVVTVVVVWWYGVVVVPHRLRPPLLVPSLRAAWRTGEQANNGATVSGVRGGGSVIGMQQQLACPGFQLESEAPRTHSSRPWSYTATYPGRSSSGQPPAVCARLHSLVDSLPSCPPLSPSLLLACFHLCYLSPRRGAGTRASEDALKSCGERAHLARAAHHSQCEPPHSSPHPPGYRRRPSDSHHQARSSATQSGPGHSLPLVAEGRWRTYPEPQAVADFGLDAEDAASWDFAQSAG